MKNKFYFPIALVLFIAATSYIANAEFRLEATSPLHTGSTFGPAVTPNTDRPILHWDLSEFENCTVPYSYHNGTADTGAPGTTEFDQIDLAFQTWQAVTPSQLFFTPVNPPANARCPLQFDGSNMIGWSGAGCPGTPGDDCVPASCACGAAVAANADIIRPAADGWLETNPNNCCDDQVALIDTPNNRYVLFAGANLRIDTQIPASDQLFAGARYNCRDLDPDSLSAGTGAYAVFGTGPDNTFETRVNNCCDDQLYLHAGGEWRVRDGGNGRVNTTPAAPDPIGNGTLAVTANFYMPSSGKILEADILMNDFWDWRNGPYNTTPNPPLGDIRGTSLHEIGHWFGLFHNALPNVVAPDGADGITPTMYATITPFRGNLFIRTLENEDKDGINFLYTPDLGDAPDAPYPSLVHGTVNYRTLNGVQLKRPKPGASHIMGIKRRQARNFTYEWMGNDVDQECEAFVVNNDPFDDGIVLSSSPAVRGLPLTIQTTIKTAADAYGRRHDYTAATGKPLFLNIWVDWNGNGDWEASERLPNSSNAIRRTAGSPDTTVSRTVIVPLNAVDSTWVRIRLDWGENCGLAARKDTSLNGPKGVAYFGEVSDLPLLTVASFLGDNDLGDLDPCDYPTLPFNPAHHVTGIAWLGNCITAEPVPNALDADQCDDGVAFMNTPWTSCQPATIQVWVNGAPGYNGPLYFNFWKDGDLDGDFCDVHCDGAAPEWAVQNVPVSPSPNPYIFTFIDPGVDYWGYDLVARARLTSQPLGMVGVPSGPCDSSSCNWLPEFDQLGEVEDYILIDQQLPVELLSFTATPGDQRMVLQWTTASESGLEKFELSRNGVLVAELSAENTQAGSEYNFEDVGLQNGTEYQYTLTALNLDGSRQELGTVNAAPQSGAAVITEFALHQNYPNPFNPATSIVFDLKETAPVELVIYNLAGQEVAKLVQGTLAAGRHVVNWNAGSRASGVYLYRLTAGTFTAQKKMVLLK